MRTIGTALVLATLGTALTGCGPTVGTDGSSSNDAISGTTPSPLVDPALKLIMTPSAAGHEPFIEAIKGATVSVHMVMFHLTDPEVIQALIDAKNKGRDVEVILDRASIAANGGYTITYNTLKKAGVDVWESSAGFSITHEKAMVVDYDTVFITAMNLTTKFATTRDFGIVTHDVSIMNEWENVFAEDVANAKNGTTDHTPLLGQRSLIWSPVDSSARLVALIESAHDSIVATTESINSPAIIAAFEKVQAKGVQVRFIAPQCDINVKPLLNYAALGQLDKANVETRVMPYPATATQPYMHSKMFVIDGKTAFVGSINLTNDSTMKARELGIVFSNPDAVTTIASTFEDDWAQAVAPNEPQPTFCPAAD